MINCWGCDITINYTTSLGLEQLGTCLCLNNWSWLFQCLVFSISSFLSVTVSKSCNLWIPRLFNNHVVIHTGKEALQEVSKMQCEKWIHIFTDQTRFTWIMWGLELIPTNLHVYLFIWYLICEQGIEKFKKAAQEVEGKTITGQVDCFLGICICPFCAVGALLACASMFPFMIFL